MESPVNLQFDKAPQTINRVNLCGQAKHTSKVEKQPLLTLEDLQYERNKLKLLHDDNTLNILCVVTNRPLAKEITPETLPPYTLVLHPGNSQQYFGPFLPGSIDNLVRSLHESSPMAQ